jgi:hypothetical protein
MSSLQTIVRILGRGQERRQASRQIEQHLLCNVRATNDIDPENHPVKGFENPHFGTPPFADCSMPSDLLKQIYQDDRII